MRSELGAAESPPRIAVTVRRTGQDGVTINGPGGPTVLVYEQISDVSTRFIGKELRIETAAGAHNLKLYNWFRVPAMREAIEAGGERAS